MVWSRALPSQIEAGVPRQRTSIHHDSSVHLRVVAEVASMIRHRGGDIEEMTHDAFRASSCEKAVNDLVTRSPTEVRYALKQRAHRSPVGKVTMYHQAQRRLKSHGREESVQVGKCARRTTPESVRNRMSVSSRNTAASMKALNSAISTAATRHEHSLVSHHNDGGPRPMHTANTAASTTLVGILPWPSVGNETRTPERLLCGRDLLKAMYQGAPSG